MIFLALFFVLALLIGANALYVAAEISAVSVRRSRVHSLAEAGDGKARRLLPIVDDPRALDRYIAASQVGITISSLVLGAWGQSALAPRLAPLVAGLGGWEMAAAHSLSAGVILVGLSVVQMILGELVPKSVALQHPDSSARWTVVPMSWSLRGFRPLIWLFNGSGLAILRLLGLEHGSHRPAHDPHEIELLLASGTESPLPPEERRRLRRALRLSSSQALELMVPRHRVIAVDVAESLEDVGRRMIESRYSRFPVYQGSLDQPLGVLNAKDIAAAQVTGGGDIEKLVRPIALVSPNATADEILVGMRQRHTQQGLVVDSAGRVAGLVTMSDVLVELFGALAEERGRGERGRGAGS